MTPKRVGLACDACVLCAVSSDCNFAHTRVKRSRSPVGALVKRAMWCRLGAKRKQHRINGNSSVADIEPTMQPASLNRTDSLSGSGGTGSGGSGGGGFVGISQSRGRAATLALHKQGWLYVILFCNTVMYSLCPPPPFPSLPFPSRHLQIQTRGLF